MKKILFLILICFLVNPSVKGQDRKETSAYFDLIKEIIATENFGNNILYRLDTLKSKFILSRSYISDYFNRNIDLGFKHRRILLNINFAPYQIDLFCYKDTIVLKSLISVNNERIKYQHYNKKTIEQFLNERNKLYSSTKTPEQLLDDITLSEVYALYCGDGTPKTEKGKYIDQLVDSENIAILTEMIKSLNCEIQAYGVTGLEILQKKDFQISYKTLQLINHIKKRNTELVICSGCFSGVIEKIYTNE